MNNLFRKDLSDFKPYEAEINNFKVILNANESFINIEKQMEEEIISVIKDIKINRYPDPTGEKLRKVYGNYSGVDKEKIMIGNGSDELISIICNTFVNSGDIIVKLNPDFSMYKIYGVLHGAEVLEYDLKKDFTLDVGDFINFINYEKPKVVFVSVPNNPTGGIVNKEAILKLVKSVSCIVVIDEAYFEFYGNTVIDEIENYDNLIILRTASKIGLAALRLGFLITNTALLMELYKVKPPYNVSSITQEIGALVYENRQIIEDNIARILREKSSLQISLLNLSERIKFKLYPSDTNFILMEIKGAKELYEYLKAEGVSVRFFGKGRLENCIRITVGDNDENKLFLETINKFIGDI